MSRQQHAPTVGLNQPAVFHQRVDCPLVDLDIEQFVAHQVKRHRGARSQRHRTELCRNGALVADVCAEQSDVAAIGIDRAVVCHGTTAWIGKDVLARHEIRISDIEGGGNQPAYIDRRTTAE